MGLNRFLRRRTSPESARNRFPAVYHSLLLILTLAIWAVINLIAGPSRWKIDLSAGDLYSLSANSRNILKDLREEVQIHALFPSGRRPLYPIDIYRFLENYPEANPLITLQEVDPALSPEALRRFVDLSGRNRLDRAPRTHSIIVSSKRRFRVIRYEDLFLVTPRFGPENASIRAEQQISSAIAYVSGGEPVRLGMLTGHGQRPPSAVGLSLDFEQFNLIEERIDLNQADRETLRRINVLFSYRPRFDLNAETFELLRRYLDSGQALAVIFDAEIPKLPYWYRLTEQYGIKILEGIVLERDPNRITAGESGYTTFTSLPAVRENGSPAHPILKALQDSESYIEGFLWKNSMALEESFPKPSRMYFYSLTDTSPKALLRRSRDPSSTQAQEGDLSGPLSLMGLSVWETERGRRDGPALLAGFDAPSSKSVYGTPSNLQLLYLALHWLGGNTESNELVFPSKSLLMLGMSFSLQQAVFWGIGFVLLLPLSVLVPCLWILRKRKFL